MSKRIAFAVLMLVAGAFAGLAAPAKTKIVFVAGNDSHGPLAHEHTRGCHLLAGLLSDARPDIETVVVTKGWPADFHVFDGASAVVVYCDGGGGHLLNGHLDEFDALMKKGVGLVQLHYAVETTAGACGDKFLDWMGGYFEVNWSVNPHWEAKFTEFPKHPIANGLKPFAINDEWYFHMRFRDGMTGVTPILSAVPTADTTSRPDGAHSGNPTVRAEVAAGKPQHLGWAYQRPDGGRGFGFTGGHFHVNWQDDNFRLTGMNAICWAAKLDVPAEGVKTRTPTKEEMETRANYVKMADRGKEPKKSDALIFKSAVINKDTAGRAVDVKVDIKGLKTLVLGIDSNGDFSCDHAAWIAPQLTGPKGTLDLATTKWQSAEVGWGSVNVGKCACGSPLKVNGKDEANGIGAHAPSVIVYEIPEGYDTFTARGGLDDTAFQEGNCSGDVIFAVLKQPVSADQMSALIAGTGGDGDMTDFIPVDMMVLPEGLEATLWAKSPLLYNPTNMDIDDKGRIWVAEGRNYRGKRTQADGDRIVVVEDTNGDGQADASHTFVQEKGFISPLGIAVVGNRIIVSQPPDMIVYTDVNGNAVYDEGTDKREVLLTGFDGQNHDHSLHSVTVGPNGQYYFNHGNKGSHVIDRSGWELNAGSFYSSGEVSGKKSGDGQVYVGGTALRVNPDGTGLRPIGHNFRNSYEQTIDSFGDVFQNDNDDPPACRTAWLMEYGNMGFASRDGKRNWGSDKVSGQETAVAEWRQEDPGTVPAGDVYGGGSPTGIVIYENGLMEDKLSGYVISCEPARNTLFGYQPQPAGAGLTLPKRDIFVTTNPKEEFDGADFRGGGTKVRSGKTLFRPSDVAVGPDGAVYISDWFDPRVGGHATRDDGQTGAIYRIAPKGAKLTIPKFDVKTEAGQIAAFRSPAVNVREQGRAGLRAAGEKSVPAVKALLTDANSFIQARALWLLADLGDAGLAAVQSQLSHTDPQMRIAAFRALRNADYHLLDNAAKIAKDPAPSVRREAAIAMRYISFEKSSEILLDIASGYDGKDRYYVEAFGIGCTDKEEKMYGLLASKMKPAAGKFDAVYAGLVWRLHPVSALGELKGWALDGNLDAAKRRSMLFAISLIEAPQAAAAMVEIAKAAEGDVASLAKELIDKRAQGIWHAYGVKEMLSGKPAVKMVYADMLAPEKMADPVKLPTAAEILALNGDATRGQAVVARCYMCHHIGAQGAEFGPTLTGWGAGQPLDVIAKAILEPSADLAHGFEAVELTVTGNKRLQGFIQAEGDPVVIRVFGGQDIPVDAADILSRKKLEHSLMVPADRMGMSPQDIRDVIQFLKQN